MPNSSFRPDQRERKFLVDPRAARSFWSVAATQLEPSHRDPARPYLYVRTTYFDTPDFAYYHSEQAPVARRLRLRQYATAASARERPVVGGPCYLELKERAGVLRSKVRIPLRTADVPARLRRLSVAPVTPCVATCYRRAALVDETLGVRVTLDDRLEFRPPAPLSSDYPWQSDGLLASSVALVLEVKLLYGLPRWLAVALAGLREAVGFSKFTAGMRAAHARGLIALSPPVAEARA